VDILGQFRGRCRESWHGGEEKGIRQYMFLSNAFAALDAVRVHLHLVSRARLFFLLLRSHGCREFSSTGVKMWEEKWSI